MRRGDLVIWHAPEHDSRLGLVLEEVIGHGGGITGWWRILVADKKHLVRSSCCVTVRSV